MLTPFFVSDVVVDERAAQRSDRERYASVFHRLLDRGVYPPPSQFEAWFVSLAHTDDDVDQAVQAFGDSLQAEVAAPSR